MLLKKNHGFTLIELMIVVLIIGILVAIAVPVYAISKEKAREAACLANQKTINEAVTQWHIKNGTTAQPYPASVNQLVTDGFLQAVPKCSGIPFSAIVANGNTACPDGGRHVLP